MADTETLAETVDTNVTTQTDGSESVQTEAPEQETGKSNEELLKIKADNARLKAALDKATKEAGDARKALRAKQSAEEIAAEEKKANDEAREKEIEALRREVANTRTIKSVMGKLGTDEEVSGKLAEYLYGADDIDAALTELQRFWAAKEKKLRLEFGKIPGPGIGGANGEDAEMQKAINLAKELGRERAGTGKPISESLKSYMR